MVFKQYPLLLAELSEWCEEITVAENHALLVIGFLANTEVADIENTVQTIKALGRVRVRDS